MFERLGADQEVSDELDFVAEKLARQSGDEMFEYLAEASQHSLVDRRGRYFVVQPVPVAAYLGAKRLSLTRVKTLEVFFENASPELQLTLLRQWKNFENSSTAVEFCENLLGKTANLER